MRDVEDADALALVSPPERRTAHQLAQLATRVKLPLLSTSPARTVGDAGSPWVLAVVPTVDGVGDGPPPAPDGDPDPWVRAGRAAGDAAVAAARRNGLRREGFVAAARDALPGATGVPR